MPALARAVGGRIAVRVALAVAAGAVLVGVSNVVEEGIGLEWAFWPFVLGTTVIVWGSWC